MRIPVNSVCLALLLVCGGCKKPLQDNITLTERPLSEIRRYVNGHFRLLYAHGGITGNIRIDYTGHTIDIQGDHIVWTTPDSVFADSPTRWTPITDIRGHHSYLMQFHDKRGYPYGWMAEGVRDGILVLVDNAPDGMGYYLQRR